MKTYSYKLLTNPGEKELNDLGAQGWKMASKEYITVQKNFYLYAKVLKVVMEKEGAVTIPVRQDFPIAKPAPQKELPIAKPAK